MPLTRSSNSNCFNLSKVLGCAAKKTFSPVFFENDSIPSIIPAKFLGLSYHQIGAMILPEEISKYQEFLNYYNKNIEVVPKLIEYWKELKDKDIDALNEDNFVHMQALMLKADKSYMEYRKEAYFRDLQRL